MNVMREHAIRDIAHRWFAFFEGETESVEDHLAMFTPDVSLVHAGTHRLADDRKALGQWLRQVPAERDSHVITDWCWQRLDANRATMEMAVSYQVLQADDSVGGAVIHYRTEIAFDEHHEAAFRFLQKTPVAPNPDRQFRDSFAANRLAAALARLGFLASRGEHERIGRELLDRNAMDDWAQLTSTLPAASLAEARITHLDSEALTLDLVLPAAEVRLLRLSFAERAGRYPSLWRIDWM
ncbi:hypothetical protein [Salinicola avicenniae]|uniref:hypothetical protein n=1 Tax=Salinicola avicenniae TaxID=2916836 RepID=UPI00207454C3|nr:MULTISPECIES: hypothetical protein [unclassified Salinicola]